MKIRSGFVSNSSSSSFIIIIKKEDYKSLLNKISAFEKEMIQFLNPTTHKKFGLELVSLSMVTGNDDSFESYEPNEDLMTQEELDFVEEDGVAYFFSEHVLPKIYEYEHIEESLDI